MKAQIIVTVLAVGLVISCNQGAKDVKKLDTEKDKVSYAIGLSFEKSLENLENTMPADQNGNVDEFIDGIRVVVKDSKGKSASYMQGMVAGTQIQNYLKTINAEDKVDYGVIYGAIKAAYKKDSLLLPEDSIQSIIKNYFSPFDEEMQKKQQENAKSRSDKKKVENEKASTAFLNANKSKPGVQTTADGLQYKVITEGTGPNPTENDKLMLKYTGKTIDGKVFDSSKGQAVPMYLEQVLPGFREGVKLMKKGGKSELFIPANLAYGEQAPGNIGPGQALIFEVELVDFAPIPAEELKKMEEQRKQQEAMMQQYQQQAPQGQ